MRPSKARKILRKMVEDRYCGMIKCTEDGCPLHSRCAESASFKSVEDEAKQLLAQMELEEMLDGR